MKRRRVCHVSDCERKRMLSHAGALSSSDTRTQATECTHTRSRMEVAVGMFAVESKSLSAKHRQQSITGYAGTGDTNSYWKVKAPNGQTCIQGFALQSAHSLSFTRFSTAIKGGDVIRLEHVNTQKFLHSHLHRSPLSKNYEVSGYGENGIGDTGDNWKVVGPKGEWKRGDKVRLNHVDTGYWLRADKNVSSLCAFPCRLIADCISDQVWRSDSRPTRNLCGHQSDERLLLVSTRRNLFPTEFKLRLSSK